MLSKRVILPKAQRRPRSTLLSCLKTATCFALVEPLSGGPIIAAVLLFVPSAVIVGFDRMINYYKIQYAQLCINENPGCEFIATNLDAVTHLTDAQVPR